MQRPRRTATPLNNFSDTSDNDDVLTDSEAENLDLERSVSSSSLSSTEDNFNRNGRRPNSIARPRDSSLPHQETSPRGNNRDLTSEEVEKLVQLQDLTRIDDLQVCRALLESKNWDLEATAREQFDGQVTSPSPPEMRRRLFTTTEPLLATHSQRGSSTLVDGRNRLPPREEASRWTMLDILRWGFYWFTFPVSWPARFMYNCFTYLLGLGFGFDARRSLLRSRSDPSQDVRSFKASFDERYSQHRIAFYDGPYSGALDEAKRELRFLLVYIHCPKHQDTDRFCRDTLCSDEFANFLNNQNVLLFGCNVESHEGYRVSQALRVNTYPILAMVVLRQNRMMIVGRQEGYCAPSSLVQRLNLIISDNEAFIVAARADRAEREINQTIRQEQDAAFQETLRQDQEKERKKREAENTKQREQEALEAQQKRIEERKDRIRQAKIDLRRLIPCETDASDPSAVRIVIKLPQGQRLERRFSKAQSLKYLFYFVFCHPDSPDDFDITTNFPRKVLQCQPKNFLSDIGVENPSSSERDIDVLEEPQSFEEAGLGQSTMLFVTDHDA